MNVKLSVLNAPLIIAAFICTIGFMPCFTVTAQETDAPTIELGPPLVYTTENILDARDRVKRVGWRETTIDAQFKSDILLQNLPELEKQAYLACLKAALFGEAAQINDAIDKTKEAVKAWPDGDLTYGTSPEKRNLGLVVRILQGYDVLTALPEWTTIDENERSALRKEFASFGQRILPNRQVNQRILDTIHYQSARLYAGLLSNASESISEIINGSDNAPAFEVLLRQGLTNEGLPVDGNLRQHIHVGHDALIAAKALKSSAADTYKSIEPMLISFVDTVCNLSGPTGYLPYVSGQTTPKQLSRFLEVGYALFGTLKSKAILNTIYKNNSPYAETLLLYKEKPLPNLSSSNLFETAFMPQTGAVVLRDVSAALPISLYFDTGLSSRDHQTPALLSIERLPNQKTLSLPEIGTLSNFNTVIIDRIPQPKAPESNDGPVNPQILSCKQFEDGASYIKAIASGQYASCPAYPEGTISPALMMYERTLYLSSPIAIDLFRVRGGKTHDWLYHSLSNIQSVIGGELSDYTIEADDYPFLSENVRTASVKNIFSVLLTPRDGSGISHRLWFVDPVGSQLIVGQSGDLADLVVQRNMNGDEANLFAVVHEWFEGDTPPDMQLERLNLNPQPNPRDFQAFAVAVTQGEETNIFLSATDPNVTYTADYQGKRIVFQGAFGQIRLKSGIFQQMKLIGGTQLRIDTHGLTLKSPASSGIVRQVDRSSGIMDIEFDHRLADEYTLHGHSFTTISTQMNPIMFQPFIIDRVEGYEAPQRVVLQGHPNFIDPKPTLGFPSQPGNHVLFDHFAELVKTSEDKYSMTITGPVEVMVEGADNRHRIFFNRVNLLQKTRGESVAGVITFRIEPQETLKGTVQFTRIN